MKKIYLSLLFTGLAMIAIAQNKIKGTILTSDGKPASSVNIQLKGQNNFYVSDENGYFEIKNITEGKHVLILSFVGLKTQEKELEIGKSVSITINFVLPEDATELEEVIIRADKGLNAQKVSAGKIAIDPMDLPQSIAVVGQATIRDQQSQRLSDVIKNTNGVYLSTTRGSTQESFSARGYGFSSGNMFKNGSRVNSGVMPEVSTLEKVEILKGSAAILYGNVMPGGIINMVTRQPKFNKGGEISIRSGSYGLFKPSFDVYGPLSSKVAFRVNGVYETADSYRDKVSSERFYINPSLLFKLNQRTELLVQADHLTHNFTPDFGIGSIDNTIIPDLPRSAFFGTPWQYNKAKQTTATATLKRKLNDNWNLNATGSYQLYDRDYYSTERIQAKADGRFDRPLNKIQSSEDYYIGQLDLHGKFKTGKMEHTLLAGLDADKYHTTTFGFNNPKMYDTINILDPSRYTPRTDIPAAEKITRQTTPVKRFGAYVQNLISISPKLKLLAGIRWSSQKAKAVRNEYLPVKDSVTIGASKKDAALSPRAGIVYRPSKNLSLFASYANSFTVNSGTDVYFNALSPSIIDQYELGIKNEFFDGRLSANLTVYKIINNNLAQTARYLSDGVTENNNTAIKEFAGQTTSNGIEIDISSQPVDGLNILAGYSYNDLRYTKTKQGKGYYIEGERLVNTPAHTANSSAFYTIKKGKLNGLKLGAAFFYTGKRQAGWNNTQLQSQNYSRIIAVDAFNTVDISAGYSFKKFSVLGKVSNLFNTYNYYVHENYSVNPIAPTQFIGTITMKF